jgi:hypothetical protein
MWPLVILLVHVMLGQQHSKRGTLGVGWANL